MIVGIVVCMVGVSFRGVARIFLSLFLGSFFYLRV